MISEKHQQALAELQAFYDTYQRHPSMRVLVKKLQTAGVIMQSQALYELFGEHPLRKMSELVGLPKPPHCV